MSLRPVHILAGLAAIGLPAAAFAYSRRKRVLTPAELQVSTTPQITGLLMPKLPTPPPPSSGTKSSPGAADLVSQLGKFGKGAAGVAGAGLVLDAYGSGVQALTGSETKGNVSKVFPMAGAGFLVDEGAKKLAKGLGASDSFAKDFGMTAGLAVVAGPLALAKPVGEGVSALVGVIAGKQTEKDLRKAVSSLDPTRSDTVTGKAVNAVGGALSGLFGRKKK